MNPAIEHKLNAFERELKRAKSQAQAGALFDIGKYNIYRCKGMEIEKKLAIAIMAMKIIIYRNNMAKTNHHLKRK